MPNTKYLVVGSSHAALEAVQAIRMHDTEGSLTLLTRDSHLPYSPTVLPYVVSGRSAPATVALRDEAYFATHKVAYVRGKAVKSLHADRNAVELDDGSEIAYEKLLLATGASPAIPPIEGIGTVSYHVLRTLDDATKLNVAMKQAKQAVVTSAANVWAAGDVAQAKGFFSEDKVMNAILGGGFRCARSSSPGSCATRSGRARNWRCGCRAAGAPRQPLSRRRSTVWPQAIKAKLGCSARIRSMRCTWGDRSLRSSLSPPRLATSSTSIVRPSRAPRAAAPRHRSRRRRRGRHPSPRDAAARGRFRPCVLRWPGW
jgi:hypothetical protein